MSAGLASRLKGASVKAASPTPRSAPKSWPSPSSCGEPVPRPASVAALLRISRELAAKGYFNERGQPFNPKSVRAMLSPACTILYSMGRG